MPKSKRQKEVSLTKVKSNSGRKVKLLNDIRQCLDKYAYIYVFEISNERNSIIKEVRSRWPNSRLFLGKNKLLALALGRNESEERAKLLSQVSEHIKGHCGLFFTNNDKAEVTKFFDTLHVPEYATKGFVPTETVTVPKGALSMFAVAMEPYLRKLGLMTEVRDAKVHLLRDEILCTEGIPITAEQARLLKYFSHQMGEFRMILRCVWSDGKFESFYEEQNGMDIEEEEKDEGDDS